MKKAAPSRAAKPPQEKPATKIAGKQFPMWPLWIALGVTAVLFYTGLKHGFVNWDDDVNILENVNLNTFDWKSIKAIFTSTVIGNYNPLPILTFAIEKYMFNLDFKAVKAPMVMHTTNLLLHLGCVYFVFRILRRFPLSPMAVLIGTLLFGIHPLRVESVTWITERKDVLFGIFYLAAIDQYIRYIVSDRKTNNVWLIYLLFIFSLLAKIQAVALPLSFIMIDYYFKRPLNWKLVIEKVPMFALSALTGIVGILFLSKESTMNSDMPYNLFQRFSIGTYSLVVYFIKVLIPYKMSPLYPYPKNLDWSFYASLMVVPILGFLVYKLYKADKKPILFGLGFFFVNVVFVLQILGAGQGFLADRFTYIAYFGLFFILAYAYDHYFKGNAKQIARGVYFLFLPLFFLISLKQIKIWENGDTLWSHVLSWDKDITTPYQNRGNYLRDHGQKERAMADYNAAIALKSTDAGLYNSRGRLFFTDKKFDLAMADYNKAIQLDAKNGEFYVNRAAVMASIGRFADALSDLNKGLDLKPNFLNGLNNRFLVLQQLGQMDKSIEDIDMYIKLAPNETNMYYEKARTLRVLLRDQEAMTWYDQAIQRDPNNAMFHLERGKAYLSLKNKDAGRADILLAQQLGSPIDPALMQAIQ